VVPDSKAAKTKIAKNRNVSANSASVKDKAAANQAVAANKAGISKEATSKADDRSGFIEVVGRRGVTPAVLFLRMQIASVQIITTAAFIARDFVL
jgi:hypothetical protein